MLTINGLENRGIRAFTAAATVAVALTALSCVPSVILPDDAGTKLALVALHVLAANSLDVIPFPAA